jgi:hypothetical protein
VLESARCPYGVHGDRLYLRETWGTELRYEDVKPSDLPRDAKIWFAADRRDKALDQGRWRPSIHMRRRDSRIQLEVTEVRVERVQDISEEDAAAEGAKFSQNYYGHSSQRTGFAVLWDGLKGTGWVANPWVWVVGFRRLEGVEG